MGELPNFFVARKTSCQSEKNRDEAIEFELLFFAGCCG